jgi:hypothetical protein
LTPPPVVLETDVGIDLDDEQRLRWRVVDEITGKLPEPRRSDPLRPRVGPLRRDQQRAELAPNGQRRRSCATRHAE